MSTEHQQYSLDDQRLAIQAYAASKGLSVVRTYADAARSGLVLKRRDGLRQPLQDVVSGNPGYRAILVYDVSRWGRFQDTDARCGSSVVATDINGDAVNNARLNVARAGLSMDIYGGSVYSGIPEGRLFDYIFWSHPFNNCDAPVHDPLHMSGMDHGYSALKEYFHSAGSYLTPTGRVLLGTGDSADLGTVFEIADQHKYARNLLRSATMPLQEDGQTLITYFL
jgi:hypothetical protein